MNELYHYGIKGMHWGIRRYQNPDGTLTNAGKRHQQQLKRNIDADVRIVNANKQNASYHLRTGHPVKAYYDLNTAKMLEDDARRSQRKIDRMNAASEKAQRQYAKRQRNWNAKNSALLSDKELTDQIIRLQREKQLKDLTAQTVRPGKKKVLEYLDRYGSQAMSAIVTAGTAAYVTNAMTARSNQRLAEKGYPVNIKGWHVEDGKLVPNANNN